MTPFLTGTIIGAWMGACVGAITMAVLHASADADRQSERQADVDQLAKHTKALSARPARVWDNVPQTIVILGDDEQGAA